MANMNGISIEDAGFDYNKLDTYSGYYKDDCKLLKSASGGAATAISEAIIRRGGIVIGATYTSDYRGVEYTCIDNIQDLDRIKGSKYCESRKEILHNGKYENVFSFLVDRVKEDRLVLFVGLGCDAGAARNICQVKKIKTDKLFIIDILCHGVAMHEVHRQYIETIEQKYNSKLTFFSVRHKKYGGIPPYIRAEFENGAVYETQFYTSDYGVAFSGFSRKNCYKCAFRGENHKSDVTLGDFWGLEKGMSGWNYNGVSIMFARTPKGKELIDMIDQDSFHLEAADTAFALSFNRNYFECRAINPQYDKFVKDMSERGLHYAVSQSIGIKDKVVIAARKIIPRKVIEVIKDIK